MVSLLGLLRINLLKRSWKLYLCNFLSSSQSYLGFECLGQIRGNDDSIGLVGKWLKISRTCWKDGLKWIYLSLMFVVYTLLLFRLSFSVVEFQSINNLASFGTSQYFSNIRINIQFNIHQLISFCLSLDFAQQNRFFLPRVIEYLWTFIIFSR